MLFQLTVTNAWLRRVIVSLPMMWHSFYRGVIEFPRDLLGIAVSLGTVHDVLQAPARQAEVINAGEDLSGFLLDATTQGLKPDYTIAAGQGLRAGQKAAWADTPCHGEVFHIQRQYEVSHDVLALAGPPLATRQVLFDFIVEELAHREPADAQRIRPVRVALQHQRNELLAFADVLDDQLAAIAHAHEISKPLVRKACILQRVPSTSLAYWEEWNVLPTKLADRFHTLFDAVAQAMAETPRSSSLVENLNSCLRNHFTLRRPLSESYLILLRFFLNHWRFMRSRCAERNGKSPCELMTNQHHPHWLMLLGLDPLQLRQS